MAGKRVRARSIDRPACILKNSQVPVVHPQRRALIGLVEKGLWGTGSERACIDARRLVI